jgi:hypothetical protein
MEHYPRCPYPMRMAEPLTDDQLADLYHDESFRQALTRLLDLRLLFEECIITSDYKITQQMYDPLVLTDEGERMVEKFRRRGVPYPQARFICFLDMLQTGLLVDPVATDTDRLLAVASKQVEDGHVRYPYTFGRLLYDKANDLGLNSKTRISYRDTLELLDGTPQGVFQVGSFVCGPFGIVESSHPRRCRPRMLVGYHCSDQTCQALHHHSIETSRDAEINENREKTEKILTKEYPSASDWPSYFRRFPDFLGRPYDDFSGDTLPYILGDALSLGELRQLVGYLLDNTQGRLRTFWRERAGLNGPAARIVDGLNAAQLMQVCLAASDEDIFSALDALVASGVIYVPTGEVRRPVINASRTGGAFDLRPQLSRFGVRIQPSDKAFAALRLRRLVRQMYRFDKEEDRLELAWHLQLRDEGTDTLDAVLEQYLQSSTPRQAVSTLLLARRSNFIIAADKLMLNEKILSTDEDRINAVLWKLGFTAEDLLDPHARFWVLHEKMLNLTRQSPINPLGPDEEQLRSQAVNYFVALEDLLKDALLYSTWCLTFDHYSSPQRFVYRPHLAKEISLRLLKERADLDTDDDGRPRLVIDDKMTLYPLTRGFGLLADALRSFQSRTEDFVRPDNRIPLWLRSQSLERFPFVHTVPFLDLLPDSRADVLESLEEVSRRFVGADVSEARNEWLHPRRKGGQMDRLRGSLDAVRDAVEMLENKGFSRQVYRRTKTERDEAGRSTIVLSDSRGQELVVFRPSGFAWLGLPGLDTPQHVMSAARFAEPSEVLRFRTEEDSEFARLWTGYPTRPRRGTDSAAARVYAGNTASLHSEA